MNYCVVKVLIKERQDVGSIRSVEPTGAVRQAIQDFIYEKEGRVYVDRTRWDPSHLQLAVQTKINCIEITRDLGLKLLAYACQEKLTQPLGKEGIAPHLGNISIQCDKHHFVTLDYRSGPLEKDAVGWAFKQFGEITGYRKDDKGRIKFLLTRRNRRPLHEIPPSYRMRLVDGPRELARLELEDLEEFAKAPRLNFKRPAAPLNSNAVNAFRERFGASSPMTPLTPKLPKIESPSTTFSEIGFPVIPKTEPQEPQDDDREQHEYKMMMMMSHRPNQPNQPNPEPNHLLKLLAKRTHSAASSSSTNYMEDFFIWLRGYDSKDYKTTLPKKVGPGPSTRSEVDVDIEFRSCQSMIKMAVELSTGHRKDTFKTSYMFHAYKIKLTGSKFDEIDLLDFFIVVQGEEGVKADKDGCYLVIPRGQESPRDMPWINVVEGIFLDPSTSRGVLRTELGITNHRSAHARIKKDKF